MTPRLIGALLALLSAASFGVMPVLTKVVYDGGAGLTGVLSVRFSVAAVVLLVLARLRGEALPRGRQLVALLLLGGVGYVVESLCYFGALTRISAGLTALLLYLYPAMVVVLHAVLSRHRPGPVPAACVVAATLGTVLTIGPVQGGQWTGVLLGLASAVAYSVYILVSARVVGPVGPIATAAVVMAGAAIVYDVGAVATSAALPHGLGPWVALLAVALVCTVFAVSAFFAALSRIGPADTAVLSTVEPVVSVAVGAAVLSETLAPVQLIGGAVVLTAVGVLAGRQRETPPSVPA